MTYLFGLVEADADEGGEADAGDKDGEEQAAEDGLGGQLPPSRASGVDKVGPRVAEKHPSGLSQDARLSGLIGLLGLRVCIKFPWPQVPEITSLSLRTMFIIHVSLYQPIEPI